MRRNRLIFYGLWILSLVGISFYGGVVSYGIFTALTLLPVVMYGYLLFVLFTFKFYQEVGGKYVTCRTPISYFFTLQNETFLAFARIKVSFYEFGVDYGDFNQKEDYELLPRSGKVVTTNIVCKYRGEYEIGVKKVTITDFFNLFQLTYKNREPFKANVLPAIEFPNGDTAAEKTAQGRISHSGSEARDILVRSYAEGDSIRIINWKATARSGKLMSSEKVSEERGSVSILLDTKRIGEETWEYIPCEDKLITTLITLVIYYAQKNADVEVYYSSFGLQHLALHSMREFEEFYAEISKVVFAPDVNVDELRTELLKSGSVTEESLLVLRADGETEGMI